MNLSKFFSKDAILFFVKFLKYPHQVGGITPSSQMLARVITKYIVNDGTPHHYLEVGPGTGVFTETIIEKLGPKDHFDVVELDPHFSERLKKKYAEAPNVTIHTGNVLEWEPEYRYDVIISSLPLNAFKKELVQQIYQKFTELAKGGGIISYFEYLGLQGIKKILLRPGARGEYQATRKVMAEFTAAHEIHSQKVWGNCPPAVVHHCQISSQLR